MTAGRYTPRKSNLTDSTAFSFSPIIFAYFILASGSAPAAVMSPHTRAPPALAARQKACNASRRTHAAGPPVQPIPMARNHGERFTPSTVESEKVRSSSILGDGRDEEFSMSRLMSFFKHSDTVWG